MVMLAKSKAASNHNRSRNFMGRVAVAILFAISVVNYSFTSDPYDYFSFRFFLLTCAFVILWLMYRYNMLLIFSLVFVTGLVLEAFLESLGMAFAIVLFPIIAIASVFSSPGSAGGERQLYFPPIEFSFLLNTAAALLFASLFSIFIFLVEHGFYLGYHVNVNHFPFEILISTSILIWLWSKVENDKPQHKGTS